MDSLLGIIHEWRIWGGKLLTKKQGEKGQKIIFHLRFHLIRFNSHHLPKMCSVHKYKNCYEIHKPFSIAV
jgi:hypothetical protein